MNQRSAVELAEWWHGFGTGLLYGGCGVLLATNSGWDMLVFAAFVGLGFACRALSRWLRTRGVEVANA